MPSGHSPRETRQRFLRGHDQPGSFGILGFKLGDVLICLAGTRVQIPHSTRGQGAFRGGLQGANGARQKGGNRSSAALQEQGDHNPDARPDTVKFCGSPKTKRVANSQYCQGIAADCFARSSAEVQLAGRTQ